MSPDSYRVGVDLVRLCAEALGMRKSQRRQRNGKLHGRPHRYAAHRKRDNKHEGETAAEFNRLEIALEIGLEDSFPASDAVAVVQSGPLRFR